MPNQGTVAPKERVNIVYRPSQGQAQEEVELPLKMLVLGDFTGKSDPRPLEQREPINVDRDNFNEVLKAHNVSISLSVPNRLSGEGRDDLELQLRIGSMGDFEPEAIVEQVPELRRMLELREALRALKGPLANAPDFRRKIQELISDESSRQRLIVEIGAGAKEEI